MPLQLNLIVAWAGILLGFGSGLVLGLFFQRENWLGGYTSLKRRLYRLGHISCFGLGAVNLLFYLTAQRLPESPSLVIAAWAFIIGAISMPICCALMAHLPRARLLFALPVLSLLLGGALTLAMLVRTDVIRNRAQVTHHPSLVVALPKRDGSPALNNLVAIIAPSLHCL